MGKQKNCSVLLHEGLKGVDDMYNQREYSTSDNYTIPSSGCKSRRIKNSRKKKARFRRKATAIAFSAVIFGGMAGGTFYGVNTLLNHLPNQTDYDTQKSNAILSPVSYSLDSVAMSQSLDVTEIAAQGLPSVVSVTNISVQEVQNFFGRFGRNGRGQVQLQETTSCGSGVIIYADDTNLYMITNYHVAEGATTLSVTFVDNQTYEAELCGYDESMDIAILKVSTDVLSTDTLSQISVVAIGNSEEMVVGEQVVAIGNALGYGQSVTTGIVSALDRTISTDSEFSTYIQTDAAINPGNSGGALLNMNGELIGINTAKVSSTEVEGMGYAIPISQVLEQIDFMMI